MGKEEKKHYGHFDSITLSGWRKFIQAPNIITIIYETNCTIRFLQALPFKSCLRMIGQEHQPFFSIYLKPFLLCI